MNTRTPALLALNALAIGLYAFGLIAPLTPSQGMPTLPEIGVFIGLPVALLSRLLWQSKSRWLVTFFSVQLAGVLGFSAYLLLLQSNGR